MQAADSSPSKATNTLIVERRPSMRTKEKGPPVAQRPLNLGHEATHAAKPRSGQKRFVSRLCPDQNT
jgi:hypothetical protein